MNKCYFGHCNNEATNKVATSIVHDEYMFNYVCDYHINNNQNKKSIDECTLEKRCYSIIQELEQDHNQKLKILKDAGDNLVRRLIKEFNELCREVERLRKEVKDLKN